MRVFYRITGKDKLDNVSWFKLRHTINQKRCINLNWSLSTVKLIYPKYPGYTDTVAIINIANQSTRRKLRKFAKNKKTIENMRRLAKSNDLINGNARKH
jgi:hypothetical protein